jgi:succinate dehydrogenase iron-sulfur subunit
VLDGLLYVKSFVDGSLAFRRSCGHGVCGSDGMIINGKERLACKTLFKDVASGPGDVVTVEPMHHYPLQRDLMVDQTKFFENYRAVKPFFMTDEKTPAKEWQQSQKERDLFDDETNCILCGSCYSVCPVLDTNEDYLGPAAIVQASRFVNDSRDKGFSQRLPILNDANGVWPCDNHFSCTQVCPRDIKITKAINLLKRKIEKETGVKK